MEKIDYHQIKDRCRQGLIPYLEAACAQIPRTESTDLLDIGCGSGVPALWLAGHFPGNITAIDNNKEVTDYLKQKIRQQELQDRVQVFCTSFFDFEFNAEGYDLILAEGFLNIIGFEKGFPVMMDLVKTNGYLVLHDEYKDHDLKLQFIGKHRGMVTKILILDETIWWNDYYRLLEEEINKIQPDSARGLFKSDMEEITMYRSAPGLFRSIYYVIQKL